MMMGRTWKAKITPNGPLVGAERPEDELAACFGVLQHGVDARAVA